jgi:hypothetical protein
MKYDGDLNKSLFSIHVSLDMVGQFSFTNISSCYFMFLTLLFTLSGTVYSFESMASSSSADHPSWNIVRIDPRVDPLAQYGSKLRFLLEYVRQLGPQYSVKIADRPMNERHALDDEPDMPFGTLGKCQQQYKPCVYCVEFTLFHYCFF